MKPDGSRNCRVLLALLALVGMGLCLWLVVKSHGAGAAAGCGGSDCDEVLSSRWSEVLGLPVAGIGALVYAALLVSLARWAGGLRFILLGAIAGGALWLVFVQGVILRQFCPWCMATHAVGMLVFLCGWWLARSEAESGGASRLALWALAGFLLLGLLQVYGPVRSGHVIEGRSDHLQAPVGRQVVFDGGKLVFDRDALPRIGPADAERVLVELFDYPCAACRTMSGHLEALVAAHPGKIAVLLLPTPLDASCNRELGGSNPHPGACEISRISLAVWKHAPQRFEAFHRELIGSPDPATARRLALQWMDEPTLQAWIQDPEIERTLQGHIALWKRLSATQDKLPKLLIRDSRIVHGLPSTREDFLRVISRELDLVQ